MYFEIVHGSHTISYLYIFFKRTLTLPGWGGRILLLGVWSIARMQPRGTCTPRCSAHSSAAHTQDMKLHGKGQSGIGWIRPDSLSADCAAEHQATTLWPLCFGKAFGAVGLARFGWHCLVNVWPVETFLLAHPGQVDYSLDTTPSTGEPAHVLSIGIKELGSQVLLPEKWPQAPGLRNVAQCYAGDKG